MVKEQEEDKMQKPDVFHLWVKLKLPKQEQDEQQGTNINGDKKIGFRNYKDVMMTNKNSNNTERVCHVCHKVFGSGKALGGHMRIHVIQRTNIKEDLILKNKLNQEQNPKSVNFPKNKEKIKTNMIDVEPTCTICGKDFPSLKALFGHMRSHPERDYRGIHPPEPVIKKDEISASDRPAVDLAESLRGNWAVTARRGRKAAASSPEFSSSDDDDQLRQAVAHLMMLSRGGFWKPETRDVEKGAMFAKSIDVYNEESGNKFDGIKEPCGEENGDKVVVMMKNKRKRKKVKLCDLGVDQLTSKTAPWPDKYRCSCCERSFTTHQALGGHMSSHNRSNNNVRVKNEHIVSDDCYPSNSQVEEEEEETNRRGGSMSSNMVLGFDLNEAPPTSDGEAGFDLSEFSTW